MAELVDALDLESSGETRAGSIPVSCTKIIKLPPKLGLIIQQSIIKVSLGLFF